MYIKRLSLIDFKNYDSVELEFTPNINCFVGENGEGKTNLLDAIYYMCFCKSYFNPIDSQNIRHEKSFFALNATFDRENKDELLFCGVKKDHKKVFKRNKKQYDRLADHIGLFPLVIISPFDRNLILEGSETRRKFMDGVISQSDKLYLQELLSYNKILCQRNALLKYFATNLKYDPTTLSIYNDQLDELGKKIYDKRCDFMKNFNPIFDTYYSTISNSKEKVELLYKSQLHQKSLSELLLENLTKDKILQYTSCGIHKDDLLFKIGDFPMKKQGSQGQQKTFLISLKLAQFDFIKNLIGKKPILLLDDIFDKLDDSRVESIVRLVSEHHFGQIFITDTHANRILDILKKNNDTYKMFYVSKGVIS